MKPVEDPKSYRPISFLCVSNKILKRLIYARDKPIIDPLLSKEQAGFQRQKSNVDQVVLLTQNIEDSFKAKKDRYCMHYNHHQSIPDRSRPGLPTTATGAAQQGTCRKYATAEHSENKRRKRGGRRVKTQQKCGKGEDAHL